MFDLLKKRFEEHPELHPGLVWEQVAERLAANPGALETVAQMEETGGEPAVVALPGEGMLICDCAKESPKGRRSLCYDDEALRRRKKNPPAGSAVAQAEAMGVTLMDESQYRALQALMELDLGAG